MVWTFADHTSVCLFPILKMNNILLLDNEVIYIQGGYLGCMPVLQIDFNLLHFSGDFWRL